MEIAFSKYSFLPSEIFASALEHWSRGRTVGQTTLGYAPFRERFLLEGNAQITLTTGLYSRMINPAA